MSIEVVYNSCYGGFELSDEAFELFNSKRRANNLPEVNYCHKIERHDPYLVEVVKELGVKANGECANLLIDTIDNEYLDLYHIHEYDGKESVVVNPTHLVCSKLRQINIEELSDKEVREKMLELQKYIK
jgi:hypothetical protein